MQSHTEKPDKLYTLELSKLSLCRLCSLSSYSKLKSINLSSNLLESLEGGSIDKLKDLKEIDLSCNSLDNTQFLSCSSILKINISFNRIEHLENLSKVIYNIELADFKMWREFNFIN